LYVVRAERRDELRSYLAERGIGSGIHYPVPLHLMPVFEHCGARAGDFPHAEKACREILSLPVWPYMAMDQAARVAETIHNFYRS
jgi:dTDP-4-amino-4,6-dideoxygalactose transaminase